MATCRSASRTYQCNEYGHWEGAVTRGNNDEEEEEEEEELGIPKERGRKRKIGVEEKRKQQKR